MALKNDTPVLVIEAGGETLDVLLFGPVRRQLECEVLPHYVLARRWYGAKDAGLPEVTIADAVPFAAGDTSLLLATLSVTPPGGGAQAYFLPLILVSEGGSLPDVACIARLENGLCAVKLADAFATDAFVRALIGAIRSDGPPRNGLAFKRTAALVEVEPSLGPDTPVERSEAEQSNTSLRIGGAMLKGFRKLEPGVHPEVEISAFLTEQAQFPNVPAFLGSIERVGNDGERVALCVLQALVPNEGDGWSFVLERLAEAPSDAGAVDTLARLADRLGRRTAELHRAFTVPTQDEAFAAEPVEGHHLTAWAEEVRRQAGAALEGLERTGSGLSTDIRIRAEALLDRRQELIAAIAASTPATVAAMRTRLHGDFHLGQVLVSNGDVFIIDFEGEPMRPLAERRTKHSPLRDAAGMLRSFAYAGAAAERALGPDTHSSDAPDLAATMSKHFLEAYAAAIQGCASFPADPGHADQLLRLFLLEKALYEVKYELANRPAWLGIPLAGVLGLLDRPHTAEFPVVGATPASPSPSRRPPQ